MREGAFKSPVSKGISPIDITMTEKEDGERLLGDEAELVKNLVEQSPLIADEKWYVISCAWWQQFLSASSQCTLSHLGPIDNSSILLDDGTTLKPNLVEKLDFTLVPAIAFEKLRQRYKLADDRRDVIERRVVIARGDDRLHGVYLQLSRVETFARMRDKALSALGLSRMTEVNLFIEHEGGLLEAMNIKDRAEDPVDTLLANGQRLLVDILDEKGQGRLKTTETREMEERSPPRSMFGPPSSNGYMLNNQSSSSSFPSSAHYVPGVCGLQNLGNTCFMNSAVQCLSNVDRLTDYFLRDQYREDLNEANPLGMHGRLAKAYADLIGEMWSGRNSSVLPRKLKTVIGEFAPRFSGYAQQDSQELLSFLLDGLHEDLNRVRVKPYIEEKEVDEPDQMVAARAWEDYRRRNDSIIVDLMHGQLKSTLICPVCEKISIKFDPFCFLSVPLPSREKPRSFSLTLLPLAKEHNTKKFTVTFTKPITVADVKQRLRSHFEQEFANTAICLVQNRRIVRILMDETETMQLAGPYSNQEFYAFQLADESPQTIIALEHSDQYGSNALHPLLLTFADRNKIDADFVANELVPRFREMFSSDNEDSFAQYETRTAPIGERQDMPLSEFTDTNEETPMRIAVRITWKNPRSFRCNKREEQMELDMQTSTPKRDLSIYDCIDLFTRQEQLSVTDSWFCPQCKKHQRAFKKLDLWRLPEILIVHLKRFQYSRSSREKIDTAVHLPVRGMQLSQKVINANHEDTVYDLMAVSNHMGGLGGGHYTASACRQSQWVHFNDSSASNMASPSDPFMSRDAYIAFYRRRAPLAMADSNIEMEMDE